MENNHQDGERIFVSPEQMQAIADQSGADERELSVAATLRRDAKWLRQADADNEIASNMIAAATMLDILDRQRASTQPAPSNNALDVQVILDEAKKYFGFSQAKFKDDGTIVTAGVGCLIEFAHAIRAMPTATPQPFPAPAVQSGDLPEISDEDKAWLHYNPNTSDVIEWIHDYARQAIAQTAPAVAGEATDSEIDSHLDAVLKAAGSGLKYYSMHKTLSDMRTAMKNAINRAAPSQGAKQ